jgi:hypothetical protein
LTYCLVHYVNRSLKAKEISIEIEFHNLKDTYGKGTWMHDMSKCVHKWRIYGRKNACKRNQSEIVFQNFTHIRFWYTNYSGQITICTVLDVSVECELKSNGEIKFSKIVKCLTYMFLAVFTSVNPAEKIPKTFRAGL